MSSSIPRYYIEKLGSISADPNTGIAKLTFALESEGSNQPVVQLIVSVPMLHEIFAEVDSHMQSTFSGPGARGPRGKMKGPANRNAELPDITSD